MRIISFTKKGCILNEKLCKAVNAKGYTAYDYVGLEKISLSDFTEQGFEENEDMVFIGAAGIAVRAISKHLKDKFSDAAVVVIDEFGRYVIPILSGHVGGANKLAIELSGIINAQPIITTATDINNVFAVDMFAKKNDLIIKDKTLAKKVSARLLDGLSVGFKCDGRIKGDVPFNTASNDLGILVSARKDSIFKETLHLVPKILALGIGCRKGTKKEVIEKAVNEVFEEENLYTDAISNVSTIDIKMNEKGLTDYCRSIGKELVCYSAEELKALEGFFTPSQFVEKITGVDNVCERAAVLASDGGVFIVRKRRLYGVTVAVAEKKWSVNFE